MMPPQRSALATRAATKPSQSPLAKVATYFVMAVVALFVALPLALPLLVVLSPFLIIIALCYAVIAPCALFAYAVKLVRAAVDAVAGRPVRLP